MLSLVIPTYNEQVNLEALIQRIGRSMGEIPYEVIVVDDDSPDGTGELAERLACRYPLRVLHRKGRRGLGTAVVEGLREARGEILGFMDADLSHPPESLPSLLEPIRDGTAEIAVGSRSVEGGGASDDWSRRRRLLSRFAKLLARPLTAVRDSTSGFFLFRRAVIEGVRLTPRGYKIGLEILVKGRYRAVREVPIFFEERQGGKTKMSLGVSLDYLLHLGALFAHQRRPGLRFDPED